MHYTSESSLVQIWVILVASCGILEARVPTQTAWIESISSTDVYVLWNRMSDQLFSGSTGLLELLFLWIFPSDSICNADSTHLLCLAETSVSTTIHVIIGTLKEIVHSMVIKGTLVWPLQDLQLSCSPAHHYRQQVLEKTQSVHMCTTWYKSVVSSYYLMILPPNVTMNDNSFPSPSEFNPRKILSDFEYQFW